jgi:hypothetical protein
MRDRLGELSADRSVKPVAVLSPAIKIGGALLAALCMGTALWATLTKVPVRVNGIAVLVSSEGVFQVASPGAGRIIYPLRFSSNGDVVAFAPPTWGDKAYELLYSPDQFRFEDLEALAEEVTRGDPDRLYPRFSKTSLSGGNGSGGTAAIRVRRQQLIAIVDSPALRADIATNLANLKTQKRTSLKLVQLLEQTLSEYASYATAKQAQLRRIEAVYRQGGISESDYLGQTAEVKRSRQSISELRSKITELDRSIAVQQKDLYRSLSTFLGRSLVFAKDDAEISQLLLNQNAEVVPGQILMTLNWQKEVAPDEVPVFLNQQAASQVAPGMSIIATPVGFSPSEIGGITGKIVSLDPYPVAPMEIANRLGSQGIAQLVSQSGGLFQADMLLNREDLRRLNQLRSAYRDPEFTSPTSLHNNRAGYLWNNKSRPPISPREGFLLATQITTRYRTPLEMLLPAIRETFGLSTPDKLIRQSLNQVSSQ